MNYMNYILYHMDYLLYELYFVIEAKHYAINRGEDVVKWKFYHTFLLSMITFIDEYSLYIILHRMYPFFQSVFG